MRKFSLRKLISAAEWRREHLRGIPFKVLRDPDVQKFVDRGLETMAFRALAEECQRRFGPRAPSKSALHRYWLAKCLAARPQQKPQDRAKAGGRKLVAPKA